ncbi:hypothetical protein [Phenylobacterium sp.]|uniref:hypothetical protein n=1 Tax=Phenylobacterium sp. TaxID=1871053 RepID=UPI002FC64578
MDFCCFGTQLVSLAKANGELAGWAQFIGAMLAICVAIWAGGAQARHERAIAKRRRDDFMAAVADATGFVVNAYDVVAKSVDIGNWIHALADLGAIRKFSGSAILDKAMEGPLSDWPSPLLFAHVQDFMFVTKLMADMADDQIDTSADGWNARLRLIQTRLSAQAAAKRDIDKEITRLRALN